MSTSLNVLIIGVRRPCYKAALRLGHNVVLWSDGPLPDARKKKLHGWIETPYASCRDGLPTELQAKLKEFNFDRVIANTEETVLLGAQVRELLGLKRLAVDVVNRFHNKWVMKKCAREFDIPTTDFRLIAEDTRAGELIEYLGLPLVIKPVDDSGAQDVKILHSEAEVQSALRPGLLAEALIKGTELSVETFIHEGEPVFHNITEYLHQWQKSVIPAGYSSELSEQILKMNDRVIKGFGVDRGMTHAEFYLTDSGILFGEVAIRPPGGYYMNLIERVYGFDPWKAYVSLSCGERFRFPSHGAKGCAAVYMLHPGSGTVKAVHGVDLVQKKVGGIFELSMRRQPGDRVNAHENTSNEAGHVLFWAASRAELETDLALIERELFFEMESAQDR